MPDLNTCQHLITEFYFKNKLSTQSIPGFIDFWGIFILSCPLEKPGFESNHSSILCNHVGKKKNNTETSLRRITSICSVGSSFQTFDTYIIVSVGGMRIHILLDHLFVGPSVVHTHEKQITC
ncbi:unnamed protein product [Candidula unifasciata]|uniref:Uncharacterized protein n=1 Tax=Candidula unifasciata TaxID=100452 RepID=A0A8S3YZS4_9EUPU|nr:unnamed protein product [Candidula unifasciata]